MIQHTLAEVICNWMERKVDENPDDWGWQAPTGIWKVICDNYPYAFWLALTIVTLREIGVI